MNTRQKIIIVLTSGTILDDVLTEYIELLGLSENEKEVVGTFSYSHNRIGLYFPSEYQQKVVELIKSGKIDRETAYISYYETDSDTGQGILAPVEYWKELYIDGSETDEYEGNLEKTIEIDLNPSLGFNLDDIPKGYAQMVSGFESELNAMKQAIPQEIQAYQNDENFEEIKKAVIESVVGSKEYKELVSLQNQSRLDPEAIEKEAQTLKEEYELEKTKYFFENKIPINSDTMRKYDIEEGRLEKLQEEISELGEISITTEKREEIEELEQSLRSQIISNIDQRVDYDFASLAAISQKKKDFLRALKEVLDEGDLHTEDSTQPNNLLLKAMSSQSDEDIDDKASSETQNLRKIEEASEALPGETTVENQPSIPEDVDEQDDIPIVQEGLFTERQPPKDQSLERVDLEDLDAALNNENTELFGISGFRALEGEYVVEEKAPSIESGEEKMKQEEHTEEQVQDLDGWFDNKHTPVEKEEVVTSHIEDSREKEKSPKKSSERSSKKGLVSKFNKLEKKEKIFFSATGAVVVVMLFFGVNTALSISRALSAPKDNTVSSEKVTSQSSKTSSASSSDSKSKSSKSSNDTDNNKNYKLSQSQYEDYVSRLSALSGIYINSDGGLGGELKFSDGSTRRIKEFTRDGELIVVDENKKETTFDKKWVDGLLARLEAEGASSGESDQSEGNTEESKESRE